MNKSLAFIILTLAVSLYTIPAFTVDRPYSSTDQPATQSTDQPTDPAMTDRPAGQSTNEQSISILNDLLKGELTAVETYQQALEKVAKDPGSEQLFTFLKDHQDAVSELQTQVKKMGGTPSTDSGVWGTWAKTVMGGAKLLGNKAALQALKEGEEDGVEEYQEALENKDTPSEIKSFIRDSLLSKSQAHIQGLDQLIGRLEETKEPSEETRG
jgi:conserved hypothetical protein